MTTAIRNAPIQQPLERAVCGERHAGQVCVLLAQHPGVRHTSAKGARW